MVEKKTKPKRQTESASATKRLRQYKPRAKKTPKTKKPKVIKEKKNKQIKINKINMTIKPILFIFLVLSKYPYL